MLPGSISQYIDTRKGYQETMPGSAWELFFHKKRALGFGGTVVHNHVFFGPHPVVGSCTTLSPTIAA